MRKKRNKRFFLAIIILTITSLFFLSKIYPLIWNSYKTTYNAKFGKIENKITTTGFVVRDEIVIKDLEGKKAEFYFADGEKIAIGQKLAELNSDGNVVPIYSDESGLVVYNTDGLERIFSTNSLNKITFESLALIRSIFDEKTRQNKNKKNAVRIITGHEWSLVLILSNEEVEGLYVNARVLLQRYGDVREYNAIVRKIITENEESIVILDLSEAMDEFYNARVLSVDILVDSYSGLMIENTSIFQKDEQKGVFRINYSGNTEFVPIKIKGSNNEHSIVYDDYFTEIDTGAENETNRINTIDLFDRIWLHGNRKAEEK